MRLAFITAVVALVATAAQAQTVTQKQLIDAMAGVVDYRKRDEFDAGPNTKLLAGEAFSLRVPVTSGQNGSAAWSATYNYDVATQVLAVSLRKTTHIGPYLQGKMRWWEGFTIGRAFEDRGSFEAQNSFGTTVEVRSVRTTVFMVGRLVDETKDSPPETIKRVLPPEQARAFATSLELVLEGTVTPYDGSNTVDCRTVESEPTVSDPYMVEKRTCFLSAIITRVAIEPKDRGAPSAIRVPTAAEKQAWLDMVAAKYAEDLPQKLDGGRITLFRVQSSDMTLLIEGESTRRISRDEMKVRIEAGFLPKACNAPDFLQLLGNGAAIRLRFRFPNTAEPLDIDITNAVCKRYWASS